MAEYLRLFDPTQQFQLKNGALNVSGRLLIYLSETDDLAEIYDENGVRLQQPAILDNNGRARGLFVDSAKTYWMDVQDQYGESLFTIRRMTPCGGGGGSVLGITDIISTDGSISIDKYVEAGETKYDLAIAPQSDEFLEWCKCSEDNINNGNWYPTVLEGTMESELLQGLHVNAGQLYHITTTIKVDPTGAGLNYDTLSANLMFNDGTDHQLVRRNYDVDSSVNDPVLCEFSYDYIPENDGYIYLGVEGVAYFEHVSVEMQVHRIYSGINAVPDTCATKQWVQDTFDADMAEKISYSALEYNGNGAISGISGTSIAGGLDSATVSAIASSYAESAASGKLDNSASSTWYPMNGNPSGFLTLTDLSPYATTEYVDSSVSSKVDQSAFDDCCSAMSGYVSALQTDVSSISAAVSAVTGQTGNYIDWSASGQFQPSGNYVSSSDMSAYVPFASMAGEDNIITSISGSAIGNTSVGHEYTGIWPVVVDNTADTIAVLNKSLCVDETMTGYESAGSAVIGVNTATVLSGLTAYQQVADMTGYQPVGDYAYNSSLSAKLDASASSDFYSTSNPSGFITGVDLSDYQPTSAMTAYQSAGDYAYNSAVSGKLEASASSDFYSTSNPSGFITGVDLSEYATTGYVDSSVSGKLDASASSDFYSTSNPSGFITGVDLSDYATTGYVDSSISGKLDASASSDFYSTSNPSGFITGVDLSDYQPVSGMTAYQLSGDYYSATNPSGFITGVDLTDYATTAYVDSSVSSKLDASASSDFYSTSNPSGFITGVDLSNYATTGYVDSSVSGKQDISGMTAYQPVGTYIYESALGWAEV